MKGCRICGPSETGECDFELLGYADGQALWKELSDGQLHLTDTNDERSERLKRIAFENTSPYGRL